LNSHIEDPVGGRARALLLSVLGAAIWILLSLLGSSAPAAAADTVDSPDSLLSTVAVTIDELPDVSTVVAPLVPPVSAALDGSRPATGAVGDVASHTVTTAVATMKSTAATLDRGVQSALEQMLAPTGIGSLTDAGNHVVALLPDDDSGAVAAATAVALVVDRSRISETGTGEIGRNLEVTPPPAPGTPSAPPASESSAPVQGSSGSPLAADILDSSWATTLAAANTSAENDALPSSACFDTDNSPD
jgi:hypothetical protein